MIFSRLVGLRFCLYFFGATISFAILYTFVDVLEKITRFHGTSFAIMTKYAGIAMIPNFITLSPIGCLIGSILLLREWVLHDQFLTMSIHGISRLRFVGIILFYSFLTTSIIFVLHETVGYQYTRQMAQAKTHLFNQPSQQAPWLKIDTTTFILGFGHQQQYLLQTGHTPAITVVQTSLQKTRAPTAQIIDFQKETLTQTNSPIIATTKLDILTYAATEESFVQTLQYNATKYSHRVISDLYFFFLKILFFPFFVVSCFLLAIQRPIMRWIYASLPYLAFGTIHAYSQLLGPLNGIIVLSTITLLLIAIFRFKITQ